MTTMKGKPFLYSIHGVDFCPVADKIPPKFFKDNLTYQPDPTDVFVATFPKAGATWVQAIVDLLMNDLKSSVKDANPEHFLEYFAGRETIENLPKPRWIKSHLPFEIVPYNSKSKYVVTFRNPFDLCVSSYFHHNGIASIGFDGTFDEFFELFIRGEIQFGDYFRHVLSWYAHKDDDNMLLLTYEGMKENPREAVIKIGNFIGGKAAEIVKDEAKVTEVVNLTNFSSMKAKDLKTKDGEQKLKGDFNFMRKGKVSDFRNYFKKQQYDRLREKYDSALKATTLYENWKKHVEFE